MIKWKSLGVGLLVIVGIALINLFFLDFWVKRIIEKGLTAAAGAKADIRRADVYFYPKVGVTLYQVEVGDKHRPFRNIVALDEVRFDVLVVPLLEKKIIVRDIVFEGLAVGTPRKTSGQIKKEPSSQLAQKASRVIAGQVSRLGLDRLKLPTVHVDTAQLQITRELETANTTIGTITKKWTESPVQFNKQIAQIEAQITALGQVPSIRSLEDLSHVQGMVSSVNATLSSLNALKQSLDAQFQTLNHDYATLEKIPKTLQTAANADIANQLKALSNSFDLGRFSDVFFRSDALATIEKHVAQLQLVSEKLSHFKAKTPDIKDRHTGVTIHFGTPKSYPKFWVQRIHLSGKSTHGQVWRGEMTNITSDQSKTKKPTVITVSGSHIWQPGTKISVFLSIDARTPVVDNRLQIAIGPYVLSPYFLFEINQTPVSMTNGVANFRVQAHQLGHYFSGEFFGAVSQIRTNVSQLETPTFGLESGLVSFVSAIDTLTLTGGISGTPGNIQLSLGSNLDAVFQKSIEKAWQSQLAAAKKEIADAVAAYTEPAILLVSQRITEEEKKASAEITRYTQRVADLEAQLAKQKDTLEKEIDTHKRLIMSAAQAKQEEVNKLLEAKKKEAEEALKQEAKRRLNFL